MGFIQPCFIRKNTPELRKKLEELGYTPNYSISKHPEVYKNIAACNFFGPHYYGISNEEVSKPGNIDDAIKNRGMIDCGTNEELFIALAALRDDTDVNQWFIYNSMDCIIEKLRTIEWFICNENSIKDFAWYDSLYLNCHKATVEELIEQFKKD